MDNCVLRIQSYLFGEEKELNCDNGLLLGKMLSVRVGVRVWSSFWLKYEIGMIKIGNWNPKERLNQKTKKDLEN